MRELIGLTLEQALEVCKGMHLKTEITENQSDGKYRYDTVLVTRAVLKGDTAHLTTSQFAFGIINS